MVSSWFYSCFDSCPSPVLVVYLGSLAMMLKLVKIVLVFLVIFFVLLLFVLGVLYKLYYWVPFIQDLLH